MVATGERISKQVRSALMAALTVLAGACGSQGGPETTSSGSEAASGGVIAVHSGGGAYTTSSGVQFGADTDFSGGSTYSTTKAISGTPDSALYQDQRYGNFSYTFAVPNGSYTVVLKFAEIYWSAAGNRVFDVAIAQLIVGRVHEIVRGGELERLRAHAELARA